MYHDSKVLTPGGELCHEAFETPRSTNLIRHYSDDYAALPEGALITDGPFRYTRIPGYVAFDTALRGGGVSCWESLGVSTIGAGVGGHDVRCAQKGRNAFRGAVWRGVSRIQNGSAAVDLILEVR